MQADTLLAASMVPLNQIVAAFGTKVRISIRAKSPVRYTDKIVFWIPRWNPDEADKALHMIMTPTPFCLPLAGLGKSMQCLYKLETQLLTIYKPVDADALGNLEMTFEIDNFRNPYNGKPKKGFTVIIMDADGGHIDSSVTAGIDLSLTVNEWATLTTSRVYRYEITTETMTTNDVTISTTIREQSAGKVELGIDIPLDPYCRVEVKFPQDMPLTSDLKMVSSVGVLTSDKVTPTNKDIPNRSFYLDGCD